MNNSVIASVDAAIERALQGIDKSLTLLPKKLEESRKDMAAQYGVEVVPFHVEARTELDKIEQVSKTGPSTPVTAFYANNAATDKSKSTEITPNT